ncbi:MAG: mechanosensitive ion channel family protein [Bacteroidales bacterium]
MLPLAFIQSVERAAEEVAKTGLGSKIEGSLSQALSKFFDGLVSSSLDLAFKVLIAFVIYMAGKWLIHRLRRLNNTLMTKRDVDVSLRTFLLNLQDISLTIALVVIIILVIGVPATSIAALVASAGVGIGLALSGTLQNFAGGVIILFLKPYKVGDFIEVQGQLGTVKEILIFNTVLTTIDNKIIYVPNGSLSSGVINNYSKSGFRRVDWTLSFAYGDDYDAAKAMLLSFIEGDDRILKDPALPFVGLSKMSDSSIDVVMRVWTKTENYWDLYFQINEKVYKNYAKHGLHIPFPQMDVHLIQPNA